MAARESETVLKQANINPVAVMGSDGTNLYLMKVGSDGSIGLIPSLQTTADLTEAVVNINTATTTAVVSATASQITRVYRLFLVFGATQTLDIKDGTTSLTGVMSFGPGAGLVLDFSERPWFTGTANTALNFVTTTTGQVSGRIYYVKA